MDRYVNILQMRLRCTGYVHKHRMSIAGDYKPGDILGGKYTVVETLGRGSSGVTYKVLFGAARDM